MAAAASAAAISREPPWLPCCKKRQPWSLSLCRRKCGHPAAAEGQAEACAHQQACTPACACAAGFCCCPCLGPFGGCAPQRGPPWLCCSACCCNRLAAAPAFTHSVSVMCRYKSHCSTGTSGADFGMQDKLGCIHNVSSQSAAACTSTCLNALGYTHPHLFHRYSAMWQLLSNLSNALKCLLTCVVGMFA